MVLGVVIWSKESRKKAVIWCEDQGALAYLAGKENLISREIWPETGDLVELDCTAEGGLRMARNVRLLSRGAGAALPHTLQAQVRLNAAAGAKSGEVQVQDGKQLRVMGKLVQDDDAAGDGAEAPPRNAATASCA